MFGSTVPPWSWFMRLLFVRPWVGGIVIVLLELGVMRLLQMWWSGRAPHLHEYSMAHLIGGPLLAVLVVLLGLAAKNYEIFRGRAYWLTWSGLAVAVIAGYLAYKWSQGLLGSAWYLLEPTIFYHHILLFLLIVPAVGGTLLALLLDGGWRSWQMQLALVLVIAYLALVFWWDPTHPHLEFRPEPGSLSDQFKQWVRLRY